MTVPVPTVSTSGWVTSLAERADRLISYYFVSEQAQTLIYAGEVISLPYQIQQHGHDPMALRQVMQTQLDRYLRCYFESASVEVSVDIPNPADPNRINVTMSATITENGEVYSFGRLIQSVNSTIQHIADINNYEGA